MDYENKMEELAKGYEVLADQCLETADDHRKMAAQWQPVVGHFGNLFATQAERSYRRAVYCQKQADNCRAESRRIARARTEAGFNKLQSVPWLGCVVALVCGFVLTILLHGCAAEVATENPCDGIADGAGWCEGSILLACEDRAPVESDCAGYADDGMIGSAECVERETDAGIVAACELCSAGWPGEGEVCVFVR